MTAEHTEYAEPRQARIKDSSGFTFRVVRRAFSESVVLFRAIALAASGAEKLATKGARGARKPATQRPDGRAFVPSVPFVANSSGLWLRLRRAEYSAFGVEAMAQVLSEIDAKTPEQRVTFPRHDLPHSAFFPPTLAADIAD